MSNSDPIGCNYCKTITITPEQIDAAPNEVTRLQLTQELMEQENIGTTYVAFLVPSITTPHGFVDSLTRHLQHPNESIPPMELRSFYFSCTHGLKFYSYADITCECLMLARYDPGRNHRKSLHRHTSDYIFETTVKVLETKYHHVSDFHYPKDCELFPPGQHISLRISTNQQREIINHASDRAWSYAGYMTACNQFYNYIPPIFAEDDGFPSQKLFNLCTNSHNILSVT